MSFEAPLFLGSLLLIGPLVALYFLKTKPTRIVVPSNALWQEVIRRTRSNSLFQRYRNSILLLIQILVLALLAIGLARPYRQVTFAGRSLILIDTSASMKATDGSPSRFEAAREYALAIVGQHASEEDIALITMDSSCRILTPFDSAPGLVSRHLKDLEPTDLPGPDPAEVLTLLAGVVSDSVKRVYILTDQLPPESMIDRIQGPQVVLKYFGSSKENLALSRVEVKSRSDGATLFGTVTNYGGFTQNGKVYLSKEGVTLTRVDFKVDGKGSRPFKEEVGILAAGSYEVRVDGDADDLESDSIQRIQVGQSQIKALVLADDPLPLMRILKSMDGLQVDGKTFRQVGADLPEADVYLASGLDHPGLEGKPVLYICPVAASGTLSPVEVQGGSATEVLWTHPLMKYLSFSGVDFGTIRELDSRTGDLVVAQVVDGKPLVLVRGEGAFKKVVCAFCPEQTNFSKLVGFPILIVNAVKFLAGRSLGGGKSHLVNQTYSLPPDQNGTVRLKDPAGAERSIEIGRPPRIPGRFFDRSGVFHVTCSDEKTIVIPVNLEDFSESRIEPAGRGEVTSGGRAGVQTPLPRGVWEPFLVVALTLVLGEWFAFCRWGAS